MTAKPLSLVGRKHAALHRQAWPVRVDTQADLDTMRAFAARLRATLARLPHGLAIAAPQVGRSMALVVTADGQAIANPRIFDVRGGTVLDVEGCLSLPGRTFEVPRDRKVSVSGIDLDRGRVELKVDGLTARMWQHECDHLDGLLIAGRFPEVFPAAAAN